MEKIKPNTIFRISDDELHNYKLHLASWNKVEEPLDLCLRDGWENFSWNKWNKDKNDFNRKYIFVLINHYTKEDKWFFGGIFKVISRDNRKDANGYKIELQNFHKELIGRLVIDFKRGQGMRGRAFRLETFFEEFSISEILKESYTGEEFPGYEDIDLDFQTLEHLFSVQKDDWKAALENVKGVYLISDTSNGKRYVGAAYGPYGIWSRWNCYVKTGGHGWNDDLVTLIQKKGKAYAQKNFKVTLLEYRSAKTDDDVLKKRETYWKKVMLSREHGYNKN